LVEKQNQEIQQLKQQAASTLAEHEQDMRSVMELLLAPIQTLQQEQMAMKQLHLLGHAYSKELAQEIPLITARLDRLETAVKAPLFQEGEVVTIGMCDSDQLVYTTESSPNTLSMAHFAFQWVDEKDPCCQFCVEGVQGDTLQLRSVSHGGLLQMVKQDDIYADGYMVTMGQVGTRFKLVQEEEGVRLIGPELQHVSCITVQTTLGDLYHVLATCSMMPESSGLFVISSV
jgi:hypothetical protein